MSINRNEKLTNILMLSLLLAVLFSNILRQYSGYNINYRILAYITVFAIFMPLIVNRVLLVTFYSDWKIGLPIILILLLPIMIYVLYSVGLYEKPQALRLEKLFVYSADYQLQIMLAIAIGFWAGKGTWSTIIKLLFIISLFMGVEAIIYLLTWGNQIHKIWEFIPRRFSSIMLYNNAFTALFAYVGYAISLRYFFLKKNSVSVIGMLASFIVIIVAQDRTMMGAFLLFNILVLMPWFLLLLKKNRNFKKNIILTVTLASVFISVVGMSFYSARLIKNYNVEGDGFTSLDSLTNRVLRYSRGVEVAYHFLPLGSGLGTAIFHFYNPEIESKLTEILYKKVERIDKGGSFTRQYLRLNAWLSDSSNQRPSRTHSMWLDFVIDLGVLGLLFVILFAVMPLWYYFHDFKSDVFKVRALSGRLFVSATALSLILPMNMLSAYSNYLWFILLIYIFIWRYNQYDRSENINE